MIMYSSGSRSARNIRNTKRQVYEPPRYLKSRHFGIPNEHGDGRLVGQPLAVTAKVTSSST